MAQKTNLNISPYYDDYNKSNNFYKVLFKPGFPVQARELTTLQSLLQGQVESFGSHMFKEGSMIIPGSIAYDGQFYAVKLDPINYGVDVSLYINNFIGKKIVGQVSGTTAKIQHVSFANNVGVDYLTIYVKYLDSDSDFAFNQFVDGETLSCNDNVTYGNTTIFAGTPFASLISFNATSIGSAASIGSGTYFIRGYFANVSQQTIILDHYTNTPSYRVGLKIDELIVNAKEDNSLYDNAKGFSNYSAPGADRFKINLTLTKKLLTDFNDTDFVELLRVEDGKIKKITTKTQYNLIRDYMAERTYDESGDYTVRPFGVTIHNSLNDRLGNNGLFFSSEKTEEKNTPSDDLMCVKVSPGKAYVRGYDVEKTGTSIIDIEKPRDTETVLPINIPINSGSRLRINNISGVPRNKRTINLYNGVYGDSDRVQIGDARVYACNLTDAAYSDSSSNWDLFLYDIQTYTKLILNKSISSSILPITSYVKGKSSGATGYATAAGGNSDIVFLRETSGSFYKGEQLIINGVEASRSIKETVLYNTQGIKSVEQSAGDGYPAFNANTLLQRFNMPGGIREVNISSDSSGTSTITAPGRVFTGIRTDAILRYNRIGFNTETFNKVSYVSPDGLSLKVVGIPTVTNVFDGGLPNSEQTQISIFPGATLVNQNDSSLCAPLANSNISSVDFSNATLTIQEQLTGQQTDSNGVLTFNISDVSTGITSATFATFDEERYSVHYSGGTVAPIREDQFNLSANTVTIRGLAASQTNVVVNATVVKGEVKNKIKNYNRSKKIDILYSKYAQSGNIDNSTINDGLDYKKYYGIRVQDEEICLNYPDVAKVLSIYESLDSGSPTLDVVQFTASANVTENAIVGENVIGNKSQAVGRVVSKPSTNKLEVVYLNGNKFDVGEDVLFEESNINTEIESIILGRYKNLTDSYRLNKGQKAQYYDYSKIVRNQGVLEPSKRILVVMDYYSVASDEGDVFTVESYDKKRFSADIPNITGIRASDTLDYRPRVSVFDPNNATKSPFDFTSRTAGLTDGPTYTLSPGEGCTVAYDFYLPRIDKLYLDKFSNFILEKGIPARFPKEPIKNDELLAVATINLPPYLYHPQDAFLTLIDNQRFTMRDIGLIEDRVQNLERVTSLTMLELDTQSLQIQDADGRNRFKSGFFVDDFRNSSLVDNFLSQIQVNPVSNELGPIISRNSLQSQIAPATDISDEDLDLNSNFALLDSNVQKTGNSITLKYEEVDWIKQEFATGVENVNPFNVVVYTGILQLQPEVDTWTRTIQLPDRNTRQTTETSRTVVQNLVSRVRLSQNIATSSQTNSTERVAAIDRTGRPWDAAAARLMEQGWGIRQDTSTTNSTQTSGSNITTRNVNTDVISFDDVTIRNVLTSTTDEEFMRSRNTEFRVTNLKPSTRFYQFLDGNSGVDFTPKLIEIANDETLESSGSSAAFEIGETVIGSIGQDELITFRICTPNHKDGAFNSPSETYMINPYDPTESISSSYDISSKILNMDTFSISQEAQGLYAGYLTVGMRLVGQSSGAVSYVKDLRLISDNYGDLVGTFFLRNPYVSPPPTVRIETGTKTFKITSSENNDDGLPGSNSVSWAETNYNADGTLNQWENEVNTNTRNLTTTTITNLTTDAQLTTNITNTNTNTVTEEYFDPLAQTFVVGGNVEAPSDIDTSDDINGAFLTAVDLYFGRIDANNAPVRVQVRTTELGTPTRTVLGRTVTLRPTTTDANGNVITAIQTSDTGEIPTKVTFPEPIYLAPGTEYAIVVISANSDEYELWCATMGDKTVNTTSLPDVESVRYTQQFALGSLFKSQNGSIWSADQYQDLKFKLYKAKFTATAGTAFFYNPTLSESNGYIPRLFNDSIRTLPKTGSIGITSISSSTGAVTISNLSVGRKLAGGTEKGYAYVVGTGSSVKNDVTLGITTGGTNYPIGLANGQATPNTVDTFNYVGSGKDLKLTITTNADGIVTGAAVSSTHHGTGYNTGDVVGIVTSFTGIGASTGTGAQITITESSGNIDTLFLSGIQGELSSSSGKAFSVGDNVKFYDGDGNIVSLASTEITSISADGGVNSGNYISVRHFNHGMYTNTNKVILSNIESNIIPTNLSAALSVDEVSTISIANTSNFVTFEGVNVDGNNPGYILIDNEIIKYNDIGSGTLTIASNGRGIESTIVEPHLINSSVSKYELNGISLRRINKVHDVSTLQRGIDNYHIELNRSNFDTEAVDRSVDISGKPQISFENESSVGGSNIRASENVLYTSVVPMYNVIAPGSSTSVNATIRTVSGTSVDGDEPPFVDQGFEPVQINAVNSLGSARLLCSKKNEEEYLSNMPRNRSFTTGISFNSSDHNLSPALNLDTAFTEFRCSRLDKPISNYITQNESNSIFNDPHAAVYVSNTVDLSNPATSLKVILTAYKDSSADFRVLYNLIKADSGVDQAFTLFPGYDNLKFTSDQGLLTVNEARNSGLPDVKVPDSLDNEFLQYEYTADNLDLFMGYTIKIVMSGTNQARPPRIRDLRTLAVR